MKFAAPKNIRPTTSKVREAIFSSLRSQIGSLADLHCLDLFAGSGALGITALQNEAASCTFVDSAFESCQCVKENLQKAKLTEKAQVIKKDVLKFQIEDNQKFNLVFADPPYALEANKVTLLFALVNTFLIENGIFVFEFGAKSDINLENTDLKLLNKKVYGDTAVWFLQKLD